VQPFYRRTGGGGGARHGQAEGGAAGIRPRQGRDVAGVSWLGRRESTAAWLARVGHGWIRRQASSARWPAAVAPRRDRTGEGRGEREGERKEPGFKLNFLKVLNRNLKTFNTKIIGNLKIYDFHFGSKFI
jgi:hypothetical protein